MSNGKRTKKIAAEGVKISHKAIITPIGRMKEFKVDSILVKIPAKSVTTLVSGSCIIPKNQTGGKYAFCKDGEMIKLFKIIEE